MDGYVAGAAAGDDSADVLETQNDQFVSVERAQSGPALLAVVRSPGAPPPPVSSVLDQGEGLQRAGEHGSVAGSGSRPVYPHGLSGALASSSVQHTSYGPHHMAPTAASAYRYQPGISSCLGTGAARMWESARGKTSSPSVAVAPPGSSTTYSRTGVKVEIPLNFIARGGPPAPVAEHGVQSVRPGGSAGAAGPGTSVILPAQAGQGSGRNTPVVENAGGADISGQQAPADFLVAPPAGNGTGVAVEQPIAVGDGDDNRASARSSRAGLKQLKFDDDMRVALLNKVLAERETMTRCGLATGFERVADALRGHEAFQGFMQGGGTINGRKCRNQFDAILAQRSLDVAKESVAGQRCQAFGWSPNLVRLVDDALSYNMDFQAAKNAAKNGTASALIQREARGALAAQAAMEEAQVALASRKRPRTPPADDLGQAALLWLKSTESRMEKGEKHYQKLLALEERKFDLQLWSQAQAAQTAMMKAQVNGDRLKLGREIAERASKMDELRINREHDVAMAKLKADERVQMESKRLQLEVDKMRVEMHRMSQQTQAQIAEMMRAMFEAFADKKD